ncbi:hypothetical protein KP78_02280 [Jeotgalibacillus soli]|uniref:Uncharacterized protein n=1 Tax=Jeotgalibacillus soli TaxID=889306 RepID=A0A0C2W752_9BACL|nr:hypothetical protein KP78_02280 [Jeotgalibacillus soli]
MHFICGFSIGDCPFEDGCSPKKRDKYLNQSLLTKKQAVGFVLPFYLDG